MGFSVMLGGAEKLVPAEYWCPYGNFIIPCLILFKLNAWNCASPESRIVYSTTTKIKLRTILHISQPKVSPTQIPFFRSSKMVFPSIYHYIHVISHFGLANWIDYLLGV